MRIDSRKLRHGPSFVLARLRSCRHLGFYAEKSRGELPVRKKMAADAGNTFLTFSLFTVVRQFAVFNFCGLIRVLNFPRAPVRFDYGVAC